MRTLIAALVLVPTLGHAAELTGMVTHVRDGDTVVIEAIPVRLSGVSAPEKNENLGKESKAFLTDLVKHKKVHCVLDGSKTHDRFAGICYLDGKDIGRLVIQNGLALDCPRYSKGRYRNDETDKARREIKLPGYCK